MYECPNCGGNLIFDIPSQQLKCAYCLTTQDPYHITKDKDAEEAGGDFNVTVFTCPQCGGEILSTDTSAAEFCSFCGASTILHSRISRERRPSHIIPFKQTKEACKKAYIARMRRAPFAPSELKDEKCIDGFRGIYIPYWAYSITQKGTVHIIGKKSYTQGDYSYKDRYDLSGDLDAYYYDLSYDGSSSFDDSLSQRIAPFHVRDSKKFTPAFLSGFYADTADVDSSVYREDAIKLATDSSYRNIKKEPAFSGIRLSLEDGSPEDAMALHTLCEQPERVLYPVWFMSYRKNGRVAYATVNGQSGKVAADIPVDIRKYVLGVLLLALPIFLLLNLFFTIKPDLLLTCAGLLGSFTFMAYLMELANILRRDQRLDDRGYQYRQGKGRNGKWESGILLKEILNYVFAEKGAGPGGAMGFLGAGAAMVVSLGVRLFAPVSDLWYYGGAIISFLGILLTNVAIIQKYNVLATRKLPQFDRKGGDSRG